MNNTPVVFNPAVPAHLRGTALSAATKALMGSSSGYRLSIKGGVWRLLSNGKEYGKLTEREIDVVVVAASPHVSRTFYTKIFDEDAQPEMPDCFSRDGETPDAKSAHKQADKCNECPQNVKGSGKGESRACRYNQALAVVLANDIGGNVLKFQVPAASIFGKGSGSDVPLREYVTQLAQIPVNIDTVVTKMRFDLEASAPKLFFSPVRYLSQDEYAAALKAGASKEAKQAVEFTVFEADAVATKPKIEGTAPAKAEAPAPAPVQEPEREETEAEREAREYAEFKAAKAAAAPKTVLKRKAKEEPVVEPTVRPAAPPPPSPGRSNLTAILEQWDKTDTDD